MTIIDVLSNYGWMVPLKDRKGETVAPAFSEVLKGGRKPESVWVDEGKESYNKHVRELINF